MNLSRAFLPCIPFLCLGYKCKEKASRELHNWQRTKYRAVCWSRFQNRDHLILIHLLKSHKINLYCIFLVVDHFLLSKTIFEAVSFSGTVVNSFIWPSNPSTRHRVWCLFVAFFAFCILFCFFFSTISFGEQSICYLNKPWTEGERSFASCMYLDSRAGQLHVKNMWLFFILIWFWFWFVLFHVFFKRRWAGTSSCFHIIGQ